MAATYSPPSSTDSPEVKFHTANGTAESTVRNSLVVRELCAWKTAFTIVRLSMKRGSQLLPQLAIYIYFYVAVPFNLHVGFQGFRILPVFISYVTKKKKYLIMVFRNSEGY